MTPSDAPARGQGDELNDGCTVGPGQRLFSFVRYWSRRQLSAKADTTSLQGRLVLVAEAIHGLSQRGAPTTVNAVAAEIGIDQSGASRLINTAREAGILETLPMASDSRSRPTRDARRRETRVTGTGLSMLADAHVWQEQIFSELTAGWTQRRRREFAEAMEDIMNRSHELATGRTGQTDASAAAHP
ncbi:MULTISPECIES: MarR family winged helix-turn-helix transcriptional regulator [unclassified Brevibacterium]|uniref:MarR family winged helix-turn-helix transcriptional regulator n=1 Tax=unclassified Brevibacterium TaxID=2614124 RepID=UPI0010930CFD|nr:MarR family winged helix-turn-helix transcriptional regulator [Brevibacterium sp. S22]TGD30966.1 MarR family transcriptional regulator [Brevibacterium sp. S22]